MNQPNSIQTFLGQTDIYLIDQIIKERYHPAEKILDAGCGSGRNMHWFLQNGFLITGIDPDETVIHTLQKAYPNIAADHLLVSTIQANSFADDHFDHIICSAVLHFANSTGAFKNMLSSMVRVLKPGGTLFIRMTSDIGIEDKIVPVGEGVYLLPDGSKRFLLTRSLLVDCMLQNNLFFVEPLKTTNVDDIRCMSTLLLQKNFA